MQDRNQGLQFAVDLYGFMGMDISVPPGKFFVYICIKNKFWTQTFSPELDLIDELLVRTNLPLPAQALLTIAPLRLNNIFIRSIRSMISLSTTSRKRFIFPPLLIKDNFYGR